MRSIYRRRVSSSFMSRHPKVCVLVKERFVWGSHSVKGRVEGREGGWGLCFMFTFISTGGMTSSRTAGRFSSGFCLTAAICFKIRNAT